MMNDHLAHLRVSPTIEMTLASWRSQPLQAYDVFQPSWGSLLCEDQKLDSFYAVLAQNWVIGIEYILLHRCRTTRCYLPEGELCVLYIYLFIYLFINRYMYICVCIQVCTDVGMHAFVHVCLYASLYMYILVYIWPHFGAAFG